MSAKTAAGLSETWLSHQRTKLPPASNLPKKEAESATTSPTAPPIYQPPHPHWLSTPHPLQTRPVLLGACVCAPGLRLRQDTGSIPTPTQCERGSRREITCDWPSRTRIETTHHPRSHPGLAVGGCFFLLPHTQKTHPNPTRDRPCCQETVVISAWGGERMPMDGWMPS